LIVDDSITTRTLEKSVLEAVGYEVEIATDGIDALNRLERSRFDLVLSDVQMPRMDGIELVTRVRASEIHRGLPMVLVSSLAGEDDRKRGLRAGADAYLDKGQFRQELLLETLERLL
jgi:two-component system chemotaxis sensor kinase CheA